MKDPAVAVKDFLVAAGIGSFGGSSAFSIFIGQPPDKPDALVLVNVTGGMTPEARILLNYPSVQVMVRGAPSGYMAASNLIYNSVVKNLLGMNPTISGNDMYRSCIQIGDVAYLGQDSNTRPMFSANFRFFVEPEAVAGSHRVTIT